MGPSLLFLDEPTTGLDSASARNVMEVVKKLAYSIPVVCTIHQPSEEIFCKFDSMILMEKGGRICYFGKRSEMVEYFESHGFPKCEAGRNPGDYSLECATYMEFRDEYGFTVPPSQIWENSGISTEVKKGVDDACELQKDKLGVGFSLYPGFQTQFFYVLMRMWSDFVRRPKDIAVRICCNLLISSLVGWVFWDLDKYTQTSVQSRLAALFMVLALTGFSSMLAIPFLMGSRTVIFRERKSNMYTPLSFFLAYSIVQFPLNVVESLFLAVPAYYMVGFHNSAEAFGIFIVIIILTILTNCALREVIVYCSPTQEIAAGISTLNNTLFFLFAGFIIRYDSIRSYWLWCYYIDIIRYSLGAIVQNEFSHIGQLDRNIGEPNLYNTGDDVIKDLNADQFTTNGYIEFLLLLYVTLKVMAYLLFRFVNHVKK